MKIKLWKKFIIKSKYEQTHTFHMAGSCIVCLSCSVGSNSATPWTVDSQALLPMGFSRQEYLMCCHFLLQGNFPTQELNSSLPHCKWILYHLSHKAFDKSQGHGISTCIWVRTTLQVWTYSCLTTKFSRRVRVRGGKTGASKCVSTTPESAPHSAALLRICRFLEKKKKRICRFLDGPRPTESGYWEQRTRNQHCWNSLDGCHATKLVRHYDLEKDVCLWPHKNFLSYCLHC